MKHKPHEELRVLIEETNAIPHLEIPGHHHAQHSPILLFLVDVDWHSQHWPTLLPEERPRQVGRDRQAHVLQLSLSSSPSSCPATVVVVVAFSTHIVALVIAIANGDDNGDDDDDDDMLSMMLTTTTTTAATKITDDKHDGAATRRQRQR